jgi:hypothetical protein
MAAYWLEMDCIAPESNDQRPPASIDQGVDEVEAGQAAAVLAAVVQQATSGGINGKAANPINASPVVAARVLRQVG